MTAKDLFLTVIMPILPKRLLSRGFGRLARLRLHKSLRLVILRSFVKLYHIDMSEAEKPLAAYESLDDLFTRKLRPGLRPVEGNLVHPADGVISAHGLIHNNQAFQVKGWNYSLSDLLGENRTDFDGGVFLTYYLCPTDYHRVHSPVGGELLSVRHLQGQLWPVNEWSVRRIKNLFCLNERVVLNYKTARGPVAVVLVGATNVGQIEIRFDPELRTNLACASSPYFKEFEPPKPVQAGDEIGAFHMGSTVVVLLGPKYAAGYEGIGSLPVKMGERVLKNEGECR